MTDDVTIDREAFAAGLAAMIKNPIVKPRGKESKANKHLAPFAPILVAAYDQGNSAQSLVDYIRESTRVKLTKDAVIKFLRAHGSKRASRVGVAGRRPIAPKAPRPFTQPEAAESEPTSTPIAAPAPIASTASKTTPPKSTEQPTVHSGAIYSTEDL